MSKGIEGKVVLITGGSTGIGAEVARLLAARGANLRIARSTPASIADTSTSVPVPVRPRA